MRASHQPNVTDGRSGRDSRATAYRYSPTPELLWAEVSLLAAGGPLFPPRAADVPVPEAVGRLVRRVGVWPHENEQPLRTILRLSPDPATGVRRPGHRRSGSRRFSRHRGRGST